MSAPSDRKPETLDEYRDKLREVLALLLEARDALPAIPLASARLRGIGSLAG